MKEMAFVVFVAQFFVVLIYFIPVFSLGTYRELRAQQRLGVQSSLQKALDKNLPIFQRLVHYVGVAIFALDLWPFKALVVHVFIGFLLIQLIK